MKRQYQILLYLLLAGITIYGLITGKFLFLVFMIPLSLGIFKKDKDKD
ncbi:hypothetical protein [Sediminibacter sp. Hel_I_10]|nr:hypothetical protein [Sediminibacter sp. Hel_I_10]